MLHHTSASRFLLHLSGFCCENCAPNILWKKKAVSGEGRKWQMWRTKGRCYIFTQIDERTTNFHRLLQIKDRRANQGRFIQGLSKCVAYWRDLLKSSELWPHCGWTRKEISQKSKRKTQEIRQQYVNKCCCRYRLQDSETCDHRTRRRTHMGRNVS